MNRSEKRRLTKEVSKREKIKKKKLDELAAHYMKLKREGYIDGDKKPAIRSRVKKFLKGLVGVEN